MIPGAVAVSGGSKVDEDLKGSERKGRRRSQDGGSSMRLAEEEPQIVHGAVAVRRGSKVGEDLKGSDRKTRRRTQEGSSLPGLFTWSCCSSVWMETLVSLGPTVPSELGRLSGLTQLRLQGTRLTGSIPMAMCNLTDTGKLNLLEVDCDIDCSCCTYCEA